MKIIAISGSLRKGSYNTALLQAVKAVAGKKFELEILTLNDIPIYNGDDEAATGKPQIIQDMDRKIKAADGILIATPEYNFSIPGGLKNATDWLSRNSLPFKGKPTAILGASMGPQGTGRVQYHLRQNLQGLEAIVMPKPEVFVGVAQNKFNDKGELTDAETRTYLEGFIDAFIAWVQKIN